MLAHRQQQQQTSSSRRGMSIAYAVDFLDAVMGANDGRNIKSAIVIDQADLFLQQLQQQQYVALLTRIRGWSQLSAANRNICMLLFGGSSYETVCNSVRHTIPETYAHLANRQHVQGYNVTCLGTPDEAEIKNALSGHICRCTGYVQIIDAVKLAADKMNAKPNELKQP